MNANKYGKRLNVEMRREFTGKRLRNTVLRLAHLVCVLNSFGNTGTAFRSVKVLMQTRAYCL